MKRRQDRPSSPPPDTTLLDPLVALLEVTASERPDLLSSQLNVLETSPHCFGLLKLADLWGIEAKDLLRLVVKTALHLDRLEARNGPRLTTNYVLRQPHLLALYHLAVQRRDRVTGGPVRRRRRLTEICQRLEAGLEAASERRRIEAFIGAPPKPAGASDPKWVAAFIGR